MADPDDELMFWLWRSRRAADAIAAALALAMLAAGGVAVYRCAAGDGVGLCGREGRQHEIGPAPPHSRRANHTGLT